MATREQLRKLSEKKRCLYLNFDENTVRGHPETHSGSMQMFSAECGFNKVSLLRAPVLPRVCSGNGCLRGRLVHVWGWISWGDSGSSYAYVRLPSRKRNFGCVKAPSSDRHSDLYLLEFSCVRWRLGYFLARLLVRLRCWAGSIDVFLPRHFNAFARNQRRSSHVAGPDLLPLFQLSAPPSQDLPFAKPRWNLIQARICSTDNVPSWSRRVDAAPSSAHFCVGGTTRPL